MTCYECSKLLQMQRRRRLGLKLAAMVRELYPLAMMGEEPRP